MQNYVPDELLKVREIFVRGLRSPNVLRNLVRITNQSLFENVS